MHFKSDLKKKNTTMVVCTKSSAAANSPLTLSKEQRLDDILTWRLGGNQVVDNESLKGTE